VIAHSFGACVAVHLALSAPGRVRDLALLDPAIGLDPAFVVERIEEHRVDESWASREEALSARVAGQPPEAVWGYEEDVAVHLVRGPDGLFRFPRSPGAMITAWSELARPLPAIVGLAGRVLLVSGRRSPFVGTAQRFWLEAGLRERLTMVDLDCGHMVYWEAFDDTKRALSRFLAGSSTVPSPTE
jgi:lipase